MRESFLTLLLQGVCKYVLWFQQDLTPQQWFNKNSTTQTGRIRGAENHDRSTARGHLKQGFPIYDLGPQGRGEANEDSTLYCAFLGPSMVLIRLSRCHVFCGQRSPSLRRPILLKVVSD